MYDDLVTKNLLLLLFPSEKFLSFSEDTELIFESIFILGVVWKLFKLSNECLEMRELFFNVDDA